MSQAWSTLGKRLPITKLFVDDNCVLSVKEVKDQLFKAELAYGKKKLKNVSKPIRSQISKSGFSSGFKQIKSVEVNQTTKQGETIALDQVLAIGDVVAIQGTSKGRGFAGSVKRHSFHGGPHTHGQSDRERAPGSIGSGTDPGRVWKGKRMAGHFGVETKTVLGLVVVHIDLVKKEVWVNGPVPGHKQCIVKIQKTGAKKDLRLNNDVFEESNKEEEIKETAEQIEVIEAPVKEEKVNKQAKEEKTA
jgi:large subunit ribosomal protein L3